MLRGRRGRSRRVDAFVLRPVDTEFRGMTMLPRTRCDQLSMSRSAGHQLVEEDQCYIPVNTQ
jgi:hypothetical protein